MEGKELRENIEHFVNGAIQDSMQGGKEYWYYIKGLLALFTKQQKDNIVLITKLRGIRASQEETIERQGTWIVGLKKELAERNKFKVENVKSKSIGILNGFIREKDKRIKELEKERVKIDWEDLEIRVISELNDIKIHTQKYKDSELKYFADKLMKIIKEALR